MRIHRTIFIASMAFLIAGIPACVVLPFGDGAEGDRGHEHREHRDGEGEHRRDMGIRQTERLGEIVPGEQDLYG